ncbi:MAG TPA: hypothetical protein VMH81_06120 [Bryobacteraceae bacterium]|nr:hypothetical protein [Bryobacteraceae bacterium]
MRKVLGYFLAAAAFGGLLSAADRQSWNKIQYIGGTPPIKAGSYDWDTTVRIRSNPDSVELDVAPSTAFGHRQSVSLKASQIASIVSGAGAWKRVADIPGASLPPEPRGLFSLLNRRYMLISRLYTFLAILYQDDDGKPAAILLACDSASRTVVSLGHALEALTGKPLVYAK